MLMVTEVSAQQEMDTIPLGDVVIAAQGRSAFASGLKTQQLDSATMARYGAADLATLLGQEGPLFIKTYGPGGLASSSFRGAGADHTAVLWNGFDLGSPMNGQVDLSLIPVGVADQVSIQYGGSSALWGSGAVGGSVQLSSRPVFGRGCTAGAGVSFGSFGDRRQRVHLGLSKQRWSTSIGLYNTGSRNDFEFRNMDRPGAPLQRQGNAAYKQRGLLSENYLRINGRQQISLRYWLQRNEREVPATLLQAAGTAHQEDGSHRATAEWNRTGDRSSTAVRAAFFDEQLQWYGAATDSGSFSHSRTLITEAEEFLRLPRRRYVSIGLNNTWAQARADGYPDRPQRNRTALFASLGLGSAEDRWRTTISLRQEVMDGKAVPFVGSVGSEYGVLPGLRAKASASRVYRVPTFNDLYWTPGGNPGLLPESGFSGELGLAVDRKITQVLSIQGEGTLFQRTMENWIIWLPQGAFWSPLNLMRVWSRGAELAGGLSWKHAHTTAKLEVMTNYVVSTNQRATSANDASVGKQLIYVPMYSGHGKLSLGRKQFLATAGVHYTGYRYTSSDNHDFLAPYILVDASLSWRFAARGKYVGSLMVQGSNLLDESYQVMLGRPMPLRNFSIGIDLRFNSPEQPQAQRP